MAKFDKAVKQTREDKKRDKAQDKRQFWREDKKAKKDMFYAISVQG